jgi:hypothetical protein
MQEIYHTWGQRVGAGSRKVAGPAMGARELSAAAVNCHLDPIMPPLTNNLLIALILVRDNSINRLFTEKIKY